MKTNAKLLFAVVRVTAFFVCAIGSAQIANADDSATTPPPFRDDIGFKGYFVVGDRTFVSLAKKDTAGVWAEVGKSYDGNAIVSLNEAEHYLVLSDPDGKQFALQLADAAIKDDHSKAPQGLVKFSSAPAAPAPADDGTSYPPKDAPRSEEGLDWDWINSDANPMRWAPVVLHEEEAKQWAAFTPQQKADFVEFYRQCGWFITINTNQGFGANYRKIDGKYDPVRLREAFTGQKPKK